MQLQRSNLCPVAAQQPSWAAAAVLTWSQQISLGLCCCQSLGYRWAVRRLLLCTPPLAGAVIADQPHLWQWLLIRMWRGHSNVDGAEKMVRTAVRVLRDASVAGEPLAEAEAALGDIFHGTGRTEDALDHLSLAHQVPAPCPAAGGATLAQWPLETPEIEHYDGHNTSQAVIPASDGGASHLSDELLSILARGHACTCQREVHCCMRLASGFLPQASSRPWLHLAMRTGQPVNLGAGAAAS